MNRNETDDAPRPRVIVGETFQDSATRPIEAMAPRVIATTQTGRVVPAAPPMPPPASALRGRRRGTSIAVKVGLMGLLAGFLGWLGIDAYLWIASAFNASPGLGWLASLAVGAAVAGAALIIAREARSFFALKNIEANQMLLEETYDSMRPADVERAIRSVIAVIPKDRDCVAAIEAFQRKVQRHHKPTQQLELLSQTVMVPLDRRAEAIVRRAGTRAFAITAISPTAITDAVFFIACSVRMVREIAACYGHRPTTSATAHLLRRLVVEAGKLGAIDLVGATLTQQIGGAVAERVAASAAESMYAAQRMARLGLVTMGLCRPIPFRQHEVPGIMSSLVGSLFARQAQSAHEDPATR